MPVLGTHNRPAATSRHTAARQAILARGGMLASWPLLAVFPVPVPVPELLPVLIVRCLSFDLGACSAAGKSLGHDLVAPSTRPPSLGGAPVQKPGSRSCARLVLLLLLAYLIDSVSDIDSMIRYGRLRASRGGKCRALPASSRPALPEVTAQFFAPGKSAFGWSAPLSRGRWPPPMCWSPYQVTATTRGSPPHCWCT